VLRIDDRRQWPGTRPPDRSSPPRRPDSIRRTSTVDILRPEGLTGPLVLAGVGRDLVSAGDGAPTVAATGSTQVTIEYVGSRCVTEVVSDPPAPELAGLVGVRAGSGFRRVLAEVSPSSASSGSIVNLLLDDTSPATLISGSVLAREGSLRIAAGAMGKSMVDICAGWRAGSKMYEAIAETGVPLLGWGPPAPAVDGDDPLGWHEMNDLAPLSMRRRRLIDLAPTAAAPTVDVTVRFRDSYWEADGTETVVHEYSMTAVFDPNPGTILRATASPGPLPAPECPSAAASVRRLVGLRTRDLRAIVRDEFTGPTTCTHLNDVFRSLTDLDHLWALARATKEP